MTTATAPVLVPVTVGHLGMADVLCDQLMEHMLDCDTCIAGEQECKHYNDLKASIQKLGGATRPAVFSY